MLRNIVRTMKLTALSVLSLGLSITAVSCSKPTEWYVTAEVPSPSDGSAPWRSDGKVKVVPHTGGPCKVDPTERVWAEHNGICADATSTELESLISTAESARLAEKKVNAIVAFASGVQESDATLQGLYNKNKLEDVGRLINSGNKFLNMAYPSLAVLVPYIGSEYMGADPRSFETLFYPISDSSCASKDCDAKVYNRSTLKALIAKLEEGQDEALRENRSTFLQKISQYKLSISKLSERAISILLGDDVEQCSDLDARLLKNIGEFPDKAGKLGSKCLETANWSLVNGADFCNHSIRSWPTSIFAKGFSKLPDQCYKELSEEQIEAYDQDVTEEPCKGFRLGNYLVRSGSKMNPNCFWNAMQGFTFITGEPKQLHTAYKTLPSNIFSAVTVDNAERIGSFDPKEWYYISAEQKKPLVKEAEICAVLPAAALTYHARGLEVSNECFEKLASAAQGAALVNATLSDDVLANVDAESFSRMNYEGKTGVELFDLMAFVPNIKERIEKMSSKEEVDHICSLISVKEAVKTPMIMSFGNAKCFQSMKETDKLRLKDLEKIDKRVVQFLQTDKIIEDMNDEAYSEITAAQLSTFAAAICPKMTLARFNKLPRSTRDKMPSDCINHFTFLGEMKPEVLLNMPASAYTHFDKDSYEKLPSGLKLKEEQMEALGKAVTDPAKHPASKFSDKEVKEMSTSLVGKLTPTFIQALSADACSGFGKTTFPEIAPASTAPFTHAQLTKIDNDVLATLKPDQAKEIGKSATGTVEGNDHPLLAFKDVKVSDEVRKILDERMPPKV